MVSVREIPPDQITVGDRFRQDMGNIEELSESIEIKGLIQPITVNDKYELLAGGRRYHACVKLGMKTIPCVVRATTGELDMREIELFENLHRKDMTWQEQVRLTAKVHQLMQSTHGKDWGQRRTAKLLGKSHGAVGDAIQLNEALDIVPELQNAPTADKARRKYKRLVEDATTAEVLSEAKEKGQKRAIVWASDHYRIGDAVEKVEELQPRICHFAEVDPPYAISLRKIRKGDTKDTYNEIDEKDYPKFIERLAGGVYEALDTDAWCVWWYGPTWHQFIYDTLCTVGFHVDKIPAIWYKIDSGFIANNPEMYLGRSYEPFFVCRKGSPLLRQRGRSNVFAFQGVNPANRIHATERPLSLMREILTTFAWPSARVLIPFLGSGKTLLACYHEGMNGFGWDLSEEHRHAFLTMVQEHFPEEFDQQEQEM